MWWQEVVQHQWDPRVGTPAHLNWAMVGGAMESHVVTVLNIGETLIPCMQILRVVYAHDVQNHPIDDLCLAIYLGGGSGGFSELGVQE
jgi:hypothetical protein